MNQKQATVSTILGVLSNDGIDYELNGSTPISDVLTDKHRAECREGLKQMFLDKSVGFKDEATTEKYLGDDAELNKYVSGLVNNWIRKNKEFNCGEAYVIKNPGSRAHSRDEKLTALNALASQHADNDEAMTEINAAIESRKAVLQAEKAKDVVINVDALPEALKHLAK